MVINALVVWLLFNTLRRAEVFARDRILELAEALPATQLAEVSKTLAYKAVHPAAATESPEPHLGAGRDRRKYQDPRFRGPERRKGGDRRLKPRTA